MTHYVIKLTTTHIEVNGGYSELDGNVFRKLNYEDTKTLRNLQINRMIRVP